MVSPITQLSDDLLRELFVWCLPPEGTLNALEAPILLAHVCHHWRTLATGYAFLWRSLRLQIDQSDSRYTLREEAVAGWLDRCRESSIRLQVIFRGLTNIPRYNPSHDHFTFLSKAVAHLPSYHFSSVTLYRVPTTLIHGFPPLVFPSLEKLVLYLGFTNDSESAWDNIGPIVAFRDCPLLRQVSLTGFCLQKLSKAIALPWKQLTHLISYIDIEPSLYFTLLPQMAELQYAFLLMGDASAGSDRSDVVGLVGENRVVNSLRSLTISYWATTSANVGHPNFWWDCEFPNLQNLRIDTEQPYFDDATEGDDLYDYHPFVSKLGSMKKLQSLSLCISFINTELCETLFPCVPHLATLDLETCDRYRDVLEILTFAPGRELLPNLKEIIFEVGNEGGYNVVRDEDLDIDHIIDADLLEGMVESRLVCEAENRLQRIVFYAGDTRQLDEQKPWIKRLRKYEREGLEIILRHEDTAGAHKVDHLWYERDLDVRDWPEGGEVFNNYSESQFS
ncbi:hypothetical protein BKA70DRAFT_259563 [Coprinopsis sp. MPI-PUGE-AT-0042]|nr:hypothetical protein BKA70DRAFT_259563 [Coprinopsis sp. MPI-PUGE-AT-0042]